MLLRSAAIGDIHRHADRPQHLALTVEEGTPLSSSKLHYCRDVAPDRWLISRIFRSRPRLCGGIRLAVFRMDSGNKSPTSIVRWIVRPIENIRALS